jgi:hypothetical protein
MPNMITCLPFIREHPDYGPNDSIFPLHETHEHYPEQEYGRIILPVQCD